MPDTPKVKKAAGGRLYLEDDSSVADTPNNRKSLGYYVDEAKDALAQKVGKEATASTPGQQLETLQDTAVMAPAGFLDSIDDEIVGVLGGIGNAIGKPFEDPRKTAPQGYHMARDAHRGRKAIAAERSPVGATIGYLAGAGAQQAAANALLPGSATLARLATGTAKAAEGANMLRKGATAVGNVALPTAITGAGEAETLEEVPEAALTGAVVGSGAAALAGAPGALRRWTGHPAVAKTAKELEYDAALRAMGANRTVGKEIEKNFPGGQAGFVEQARSMDIGTGMIPSPRRALDESRAAAERIGAERKALEEQARHLMIPSAEVASAVEAKGKSLPWPAEDVLRGKYFDEASKLRRMGQPIPGRPAVDPRVPIEASFEDAGPQARGFLPGSGEEGIVPYEYKYRSPELPSGDGPGPIRANATVLNPPATPPSRGNEISFPDLNENLRAYNKNAYLAQREKQGQQAELNRETGHIINDILERHANKLPEEVGTPWRQKKRLENVAIRSEDMAAAGMSGSNLGKGVKLFGAIAGTGASILNPLAAIPAAVGLAATYPGVQMRAAQGLGAISRAAQQPVSSTLGRILTKYGPAGERLGGMVTKYGPKVVDATPGPVGRLAVHLDAQQGITEVQEAALRGDEEAVAKHYELGMTNPEYNRESLKED